MAKATPPQFFGLSLSLKSKIPNIVENITMATLFKVKIAALLKMSARNARIKNRWRNSWVRRGQFPHYIFKLIFNGVFTAFIPIKINPVKAAEAKIIEEKKGISWSVKWTSSKY